MTAPALTPAPLELARLAAVTAQVDEARLIGWLQGHLTAGIKWPVLWQLVDHWLWTGREWHELETALDGWKLRNPTRQGARP